jgi:hypothetical protein
MRLSALQNTSDSGLLFSYVHNRAPARSAQLLHLERQINHRTWFGEPYPPTCEAPIWPPVYRSFKIISEEPLIYLKPTDALGTVAVIFCRY